VARHPEWRAAPRLPTISKAPRSRCWGSTEKAPHVVCLPELFSRPVFLAQREARRCSTSRTYPRPSTESSPAAAPANKVVLSVASREAARPASIQPRPDLRFGWRPAWLYRKSTSTIRATTKNFLVHARRLGVRLSTTSAGKLRHTRSAGTIGTRSRAPSPALQRSKHSFYPTPDR